MKLTVLGSGTCVPSLKRNAPGYYLEAGSFQVLVDCGSGILNQMERAKKSYKQLDAVLITHRHPDHFSDLMPLIHALLATPKFRREKELTIIAPHGFKKYYDSAISSVLGRSHNFPLNLIEMEDKIDLGPFHVLSARTVHSQDSLAYRFKHRNKSIVFTGDADYDQGIIALAQNADLLIADCSYPASMKTTGHLSAKECGLVAQRAGVKKLLLSHLYPSDSPDIERVKESQDQYDGEVILAEDMMQIEI